MMRFWLLVGLLLTLGVGVVAQEYKPNAGETVLRLSVKDRGEVAILLYTDKAPKATSHIIGLTEKGFYDNQPFFKVVKEPRPFLVQFGDPKSKELDPTDPTLGAGGSGTKIPYENSGLPNDAGYVGLATKPRYRDSGDSQFYILLAPSKFLDGNYTVFGKVVSGMEIVKKIELGDTVTSAKIVRGPKR